MPFFGNTHPSNGVASLQESEHGDNSSYEEFRLPVDLALTISYCFRLTHIIVDTFSTLVISREQLVRPTLYSALA